MLTDDVKYAFVFGYALRVFDHRQEVMGKDAAEFNKAQVLKLVMNVSKKLELKPHLISESLADMNLQQLFHRAVKEEGLDGKSYLSGA